MRKVFVSTPWFSPAYRAGGPIQSVENMVKGYTENVHYFIYTSDTDLNGAALENVQTDDWIPFHNSGHVWYSSPEKISENLVKQVERIKPDVLFVVGLYSWHFNLVPLIYCKVPLKIISARGMLHPEALRQKAWKKKLFLRGFKLLEYHYKVVFHATDEHEAADIRKAMGPVARIRTAHNFPNEISFVPVGPKAEGCLKLVSVGIVSPMKNYLLVLEALELLQSRIQYEIYGAPKDENYWHECREKAKRLPPNVQVRFHREVEPAKVPGVLAAAHVFVLPSKSENFGHAIVEALFAGRPVIIGPNTPWQGLERAGAGFVVDTETPGQLRAAIKRFAEMQQAELAEFAAGARRYAESAIDPAEMQAAYKRLFQP